VIPNFIIIAIQGDSGGKVSILGGRIIGHCEKKISSYVNVSNSEWLPRESCLKVARGFRQIFFCVAG
jgi:hypothetical protein